VDEVIDGVKQILHQNVTSVHHGHMPEITLLDTHNASGIWGHARCRAASGRRPTPLF
jgi:hypothetical protein